MLVGHSHGGNIAMRACHMLEKTKQAKVVCITMGTPFLKLERRFDAFDLYDSLPSSLAQYLRVACLIMFILFFWFGAIWLDKNFALFGGSLAEIIFSRQSASLMETGIIIALFFGPLILAKLLHSPLKRMIQQAKSSSAEFGPRQHDLTQDELTVHAITYAQDEVYQILSLVLHSFSLMHQALFWLAARLSKVINLLKLVENIGWLILAVTLLPIPLILGISFLCKMLDEMLPILSEVSRMGAFITGHLWNFGQEMVLIAIVEIFAVLITSGGVCIRVIMLLLIFGFLRLCVLNLVGVVDEIYVRGQMLTMLLGTYSISAIPAGYARTYLLEGRELFNHTQIYNDPRVVRYIGDLLASGGKVQNRRK